MKNHLFLVWIALLAMGCNSSGDSFVSAEESSEEEGLADLEELSESEEEASSEDSLKEEDAEGDSEETAVSSESDEPETAESNESPEPSCASDEDCDDSLDCTEDQCADGECSWKLKEEHCLIDNACLDAGELSSVVNCKVCDPGADAFAWSIAGDGTPCEDDNFCTADDACLEGGCTGSPVMCEAGGPCTDAVCQPTLGCVQFPGESGGPCDDGTACTQDDACLGGLCLGGVVDCDDGNTCTEDSCDPEEGCLYIELDATPCEDGNPCTGGDTCEQGVCITGEGDGCDDFNACTVDVCEEGFGCGHVPLQSPCCIGATSKCDDDNPCTLDNCDPQTLDCSYSFLPAGEPCDDGSVCTSGESCAEDGACVGTVKDCDDGNSCTEDTCDPGTGVCNQLILDGVPCDDGKECSFGDTCSEGECVADTSECECEANVYADANKMSAFAIGANGEPGQGLDVDADGDTCSPEGDCSEGIDNSFSVMAGFTNESLVESLASGEVILVTELNEDNTILYFHQGQVAPWNVDCDFMAQTCDYLLDPAGLDEKTCEPLIEIPVSVDGNTLVGGGPGTILPFQVPLPGASLELPIYDVRIEAELTFDEGQVSSMSGVMGGAIEKGDLLASIDALPDDGSLPVPKESIKVILDLTLNYDIDVDGDGTNEAASIGLSFAGIDAKIGGLYGATEPPAVEEEPIEGEEASGEEEAAAGGEEAATGGEEAEEGGNGLGFTGSCEGLCGGESTDCYCDSACVQYADCCSDVCEACGLHCDYGPIDCPEGLEYEGCCNDSVLTWCENGIVVTVDCPLGCGVWQAGSGYNCFQQGDPGLSADPSGALPIECSPEIKEATTPPEEPIYGFDWMACDACVDQCMDDCITSDPSAPWYAGEALGCNQDCLSIADAEGGCGDTCEGYDTSPNQGPTTQDIKSCLYNKQCGKDGGLQRGLFGDGFCFCNAECVAKGNCCDDACSACGFCD